jgi:hypothetical protein
MASADHRLTAIEHNVRLLSESLKGYADRVEHVESASKLSEQCFNHRITAVEGTALAFNWQLSFFDAKFGKRLDGMESKIIALDKKVDERMDKIETRMEGVEKKMDHIIALLEAHLNKSAAPMPAF